MGDLPDLWLALSIAEAAIALLLFVRVAAGPTVADRVIAINATSTQTTLALLFFAAYAGRTIYLDVALWMAAFSYLATFVYARLTERELL